MLHAAAINAVNAAECVAVLARFTSAREAAASLARLGLEVIVCDWDLAIAAADIHAATRDRGLSLGDCICLATARSLGVSAITADGGWRALGVGVAIEILR
jgi:ribonuclease VapC